MICFVGQVNCLVKQTFLGLYSYAQHFIFINILKIFGKSNLFKAYLQELLYFCTRIERDKIYWLT